MTGTNIKLGFWARRWQQFAILITKGPITSVAAAAVLQSIAFFLPIFNFLSSSSIALFCFHYRSIMTRVIILLLALSAMAVVLILLTTADQLAPDKYWGTLGFIVMYWIPPAILAHVWWRTSLSLMMQALGVCAVAAVLVAHMSVDDLPGAWREFIYQHLVSAGDLQSPELLAIIQSATESMTGLVASAFVMSWLAWLMFGRWMQTLMERPGEFRDEAVQGGMGVVLATTMAVVATAWALDAGAIWKDLGFALAPLFLLQGTLTVHCILVSTVRNARPWLTIFYVLLVMAILFAQYLVLMLVVLGALENFLRLRSRAMRRTEGTN